jgi:hypothetical protein
VRRASQSSSLTACSAAYMGGSEYWVGNSEKKRRPRGWGGALREWFQIPSTKSQGKFQIPSSKLQMANSNSKGGFALTRGTSGSFMLLTSLPHRAEAFTYRSERFNTRATHIQCCPRQPRSLSADHPGAPAKRVRSATTAGSLNKVKSTALIESCARRRNASNVFVLLGCDSLD